MSAHLTVNPGQALYVNDADSLQIRTGNPGRTMAGFTEAEDPQAEAARINAAVEKLESVLDADIEAAQAEATKCLESDAQAFIDAGIPEDIARRTVGLAPKTNNGNGKDKSNKSKDKDNGRSSESKTG